MSPAWLASLSCSGGGRADNAPPKICRDLFSLLLCVREDEEASFGCEVLLSVGWI